MSSSLRSVRSAVLVLVLALAAGGCGVIKTDAIAEPKADAPSASENRALDLTPRVLGVRGTGESAPAAVVTITFRNRSADTLELRAYRVRWPGGTFTAEVRGLVVPPGTEVQRTARVDSGAGDIAMLVGRPADVVVDVVSSGAQ